jgi:hypothetical protein
VIIGSIGYMISDVIEYTLLLMRGVNNYCELLGWNETGSYCCQLKDSIQHFPGANEIE